MKKQPETSADTGPTAAEVARSAGVSKWTVMRAFAEGAPIADETRSRVLTTAREMGYQPNLLARSLAKRKTGQVAIITRSMSATTHEALLHLVRALQRQDFLAVVIATGPELDLKSALAVARQRRMDAAIILTLSGDKDALLKEGDVPAGLRCVVLGHRSNLSGVSSVHCDERPMIKALVARLRSEGRTSPAILSHNHSLTDASDSFRTEWLSHGIRTNLLSIEHSSACSGKLSALGTLFERWEELKFDCIFCEDLALSQSMMGFLRDRLSDQSSDGVVVISNEPPSASSALRGRFAYMRQPSALMSKKAVDLIVNVIESTSISVRGTLVPW